MTDQDTAPAGARTLWEGAADAVRRAIVTGVLPDGARVSEASLAETLGVSWAPVRDAVRVLVREGLLQQGAWATTVIGCSPDDIRQLFELRAHLEVYATQRAAAALADEAREELSAATQQMLSAVGAPTERLHRADLAFHRALVRAARSLAAQRVAEHGAGDRGHRRWASTQLLLRAGDRDRARANLALRARSRRALGGGGPTLPPARRGAPLFLLKRLQAPDP